MHYAREGLLFCVSSPAGAGKTTVCNLLLKSEAGRLKQSVSVTSRAPRPDEKSGLSYEFVSRSEFEARVSQGFFYEWEEVHGNLYGTPRRTIEEAISSGQDLLLVIDIKGARNLKLSFPNNAVLCFVVPPSLDVLKHRLSARGSISEVEFATRLATAKQEFANVLSAPKSTVDYLVVNDKLDETVRELEGILRAERARLKRIKAEDLNRLLATGI